MVRWSGNAAHLVAMIGASEAPSLSRETRSMLGDPRSWGFGHGIRRPRPAFPRVFSAHPSTR
jgi:hypothetical protein